jgi:hypothetical protein
MLLPIRSAVELTQGERKAPWRQLGGGGDGALAGGTEALRGTASGGAAQQGRAGRRRDASPAGRGGAGVWQGWRLVGARWVNG